MYRLPIPRLTAIQALRTRIALRYSSGSPTAGNASPDHFTKTGEKEDDPAKINSRSNEYSQSGGDEMVAAQESASFNRASSNDPAVSKAKAGEGNVVNPLELSPATPDLSKILENKDVSKGKEREVGQHSGQGISRKAKTVKKSKLDFRE